jgi:hypothetical protein
MEIAFSGKHSKSGSVSLQSDFCLLWPEIKDSLADMKHAEGDPELREHFLNIVERQIQSVGQSYLKVIQSLEHQHATLGTGWLDSIVQYVNSEIGKLIPAGVSPQKDR